MKFEATYSFNVRRFVRREIECTNADEAIRKAKALADDVILTEMANVENMEGLGTVAGVDASIYVTDSAGAEIFDENWETLD